MRSSLPSNSLSRLAGRPDVTVRRDCTQHVATVTRPPGGPPGRRRLLPSGRPPQWRLCTEAALAGPRVSPTELDADSPARAHQTFKGDAVRGIGLLRIKQLAVEEDKPFAEVTEGRRHSGLDDLGEAQSSRARLSLGEDSAHVRAIGHVGPPSRSGGSWGSLLSRCRIFASRIPLHRLAAGRLEDNWRSWLPRDTGPPSSRCISRGRLRFARGGFAVCEAGRVVKLSRPSLSRSSD